ncbi:MAG: hypothetical protein LUG51_13170 [Tannerellaceae bacterium]|nr:hypothetical protein [Tannerellaceae bacterium]
MEKTLYYRTIYLEYASLLIRFAQKFVSAFAAEDIVQDVFLKLWDKQLFLLPEKELKTYFSGIGYFIMGKKYIFVR